MKRIPLFPLGLVLLPGMALPLHIFEERYKLMISECLAAETPFGIVFFDGHSIRSVGCMARVYRVLHRYEDGRMDILTRGERRFFIHEIIEEKPYMEAQAVFFDDEAASASENSAEFVRNAQAALRQMKDTGLPDDILEGAGPHCRTRPPDDQDPEYHRRQRASAALHPQNPRGRQGPLIKRV
jgi:Lon protease-like protein